MSEMSEPQLAPLAPLTYDPITDEIGVWVKASRPGEYTVAYEQGLFSVTVTKKDEYEYCLGYRIAWGKTGPYRE
jgi:hypothetical protein